MPEAAIARARGRRADAAASIRRAVTEARAQGARWLELLALTELCEHAAATVAESSALGALVADVGEGVQVPALARARALLEGRHSP